MVEPGTVDPFAGVIHAQGAEVFVCRHCRAAYSAASLAAVRGYDDRCMTCRRSFQASLPTRAVVAGAARLAGQIRVTPQPGAVTRTRTTTPAQRANGFYQPTMRVVHDSLGLGVVESVEYRKGMVDIVNVRFESDPDELIAVIGNYPNMDAREWD